MRYPHLFIGLFAIFCSISTHANTKSSSSNQLKSILRYALTEDPRILEAQANIQAAQSQTKISQAGHYPIISVTNTQMLAQHHRNSGDKKQSRPALKGQVNLYAWGAIENEVERDRHKEGFFTHKKAETQEQTGKSIIELYLIALRAKENIAIYQESLKRHKTILGNIKTIATYDGGRAFEVDEAQSRVLQVEAILAQQTRVLEVTLSQLNRYTKVKMSAQDLQEPFANQPLEQFLSTYKNAELQNNPTYLAQQKELHSTQAGLKAAKAKRLPAINLQSELYNGGYEVYLGVSWNIFDLASGYSVDQNQHTEAAARAKLQDVLLELQEQSRSSEIDLKQNSKRLVLTKKQIQSQKKVIESVELQFEIAQRSLVDVLNAHKELTEIQVEEANIKNDYRVAAVNYLVSQANVAKWAGLERVSLKF